MKNRLSLFRIIVGGAIGAALSTGCQKDTETVSPNKTKTQQLTALPWHITAYTRTIGTAAAADLRPAQACARDDRFVFGTNKVLTQKEGPTQCNGGTPETVVSTRTWNLDAAETTLSLGAPSMGSAVTDYKIDVLTSDALQISYSRMSSGALVVDRIVYAN